MSVTEYKYEDFHAGGFQSWECGYCSDTGGWVLGVESPALLRSSGPAWCLREELTPRSLLFPAMWVDGRPELVWALFWFLTFVQTDVHVQYTGCWRQQNCKQSWACLGFVLISQVCTDRCTWTVHRLLYTSKSCLGNIIAVTQICNLILVQSIRRGFCRESSHLL